MRGTSSLGFKLAGSTLALFAATPALAQDGATEPPAPPPPADPARPDGALPTDIIVTATKQAERISRVPISISAYDQDLLDKQSVRNFRDIARMTPGVTFTPGTRGNGTANSVSIRGISSGAGTATVGVYIDETPVQMRPGGNYDSSNPYPRIFDLDRVEILRGPQGTLFGAGSEGGTIRFITPEPSLDKYSVYGRAELAATEGGSTSYEAGVAVGGPIIDDRLGFRVSGWYRRDGGYVDKIDWFDRRDVASNVDWSTALVLRGSLKWQPTDDLVITPSLFYQKSHINDTSVFWETYSNPKKGKFVSGNRLRTPNNDKFWLPSLKVDFTQGPIEIISNTSYFHRDNDNIYDSTTLDVSSFTFASATPVDTAPPPAALRHVYSPAYVTSGQRIFTQEVRVQNSDPSSRLTWVLGFYFQRARQNSSYNVESMFINEIIQYGFGFPGITVKDIFGADLYHGKYLFYSNGRLVDKEVAGFGQLGYKITDRLTVNAGVRVSKVTSDSIGSAAGPVVAGAETTTIAHTGARPVTPKFGITYQATRDLMVYASAAKGFRPGSTTGEVSTRCLPDLLALGFTTAPREIKPDSVWSYELGAKARLFGGRLAIDGSVYRIDWKNIQSGLTLPNCNTPFAANFGDARSQGFDLAINARVTDGLTLSAAIGYSDAKYTTNTVGAGGIVIRSKGEPLPIAPWQVSLSGQYEFRLAGHDAYANASYQYQSHDDTPLDTVPSIDRTLPRAPASNNVDLRFGMKFGDFDISVFGLNMLDQTPLYGRFRDSLSSANYRSVTVRPRTFGVIGVFRY